MQQFHKSKLSWLIIVLIITGFSYSKGLSGPFLYDDNVNLQPLAEIAKSNNNSSLTRYIVSSKSGPLGRPVSFASFVFNADDWPKKPFNFKLINLLIHLANGILIYFFITKLIRYITPGFNKDHSELIAFVTASIWLIHPFHVSTTLYVIQRMTLLSTTFSISALLVFLNYEGRFRQANTVSAFLFPSVLFFLLTSLAVLSKENAILIFPTVILLNYIGKMEKSKGYKLWITTFAIIPLTIAVVALLTKVDAFQAGYAYKDFSLLERLLTQPRVLIDYLQQIILPNSQSMSLFHDDFPLSTSLLSPTSTIVSIVILFSLMGLMFFNISKIYTFGISWFVIWHLLESTIIPLEMYFEHRNYIPSIGIIFMVVYAGYQLFQIKKLRPVFLSVPIIISIGLLLQLNMITTKWGDNEELLQHWYKHHNKSQKTILSLIQAIETKDLTRANIGIDQILASNNHNTDLAILLKDYTIKCQLGMTNGYPLDNLISVSSIKSSYSLPVLTMQASLALNIIQNRCAPDDIQKVQSLLLNIQTIAPQAVNRRWESDVQSKRAFIYLKYGDIDRALELFKSSYGSGRHNELLAIIDLSIRTRDFSQARKWLTRAKNELNQQNVDISQHVIALENKLNASEENSVQLNNQE